MKVLSIEKSSGSGNEATISLLPQDKEDLFTIYQIVDEDDEVIFKRMVTSNLDESGKKKSTDLMLLKLKIISSEFDMKNESLRYKGITVTDDSERANINVPVGKFFSFDVGFTYPFTLIKQEFNKYEEKILQEACQMESRSDTAAVVLQEGISHVCLLTDSSTILKQKIEYSLPKKKRTTDVMKYDEKTDKFYKVTYEAMKKNFDFESLKIIIICSPGFYAKTLFEKVIQYAQEEQNKTILDNKSKILIAHCSTGYIQGITEVLKNPVYSSKLQDTKNSREVLIMDKFLSHLNDDDFKAWYGEAEVSKAADMGAIDTLLITDTLLRTDDFTQRKKYLDLVELIENMGGTVFVFSTLHNSGEELDKLTGLACILKYPLPDLDEDLEEE